MSVVMLVRQCSWCNAVQDATGRYKPHGEVLDHLTHGVCPDCQARMAAGKDTPCLRFDKWGDYLGQQLAMLERILEAERGVRQ